MARKYRHFEEVHPDEKFDWEKAFEIFWEKHTAKGSYAVGTHMVEEAFKAGWEAAEAKILEDIG